MKISVVMPTYNDKQTICKTLDSLMSQTYQDWELVIVDDGSTDGTRETITAYKKEYDKHDQIYYLYQENQDQLKAVQNAIPFLSGDYVYILHSDDLLYSTESFGDFVEYQNKHIGYDAYYGNIQVINAQGENTSIMKVLRYRYNSYRLALIYLWLGRNLYSDSCFFRMAIFKQNVNWTYLTWNMPFWIDLESKKGILNVKKFNYTMFKYRVYGENYINNEVGKCNVLNGELRTATQLMSKFYMPLYAVQYLTYRTFNRLHLGSIYRPIYFQREEKNKAEVVDYIIKKRFPNGYAGNEFFACIAGYYKNYIPREITLKRIPDDLKIFRGNDMRFFNNLLLAQQLPEFYYDFMKEIKLGFSVIKCCKGDYEKVVTLTRFFCLFPFVNVIETS